MKRSKRIVILLVSSSLVLGCLQGGCASETAQSETQPPAPAEPLSAPLPATVSSRAGPVGRNRSHCTQMRLVAQILAAATYPTQIVEADRWLPTTSGFEGSIHSPKRSMPNPGIPASRL